MKTLLQNLETRGDTQLHNSSINGQIFPIRSGRADPLQSTSGLLSVPVQDQKHKLEV
jgi:hypothetical protein